MDFLTVEHIETAISELPDSISGRETKRELEDVLGYVKRGILIKATAPLWVKATNQIYISKIEGIEQRLTA